MNTKKLLMSLISACCCVWLLSPANGMAQVSGSGVEESIDTANTMPVKEYVPKIIIAGKWGNDPKEFGFVKDKKRPIVPRAVFARKGIIYILDSANLRVLKYTKNGNFVGKIPLERIMKKTENGYLLKVTNSVQIAPRIILGDSSDEFYVDQNENIYVAGYGGAGRSRIYIYTKRGKLLREIWEENLKEDEYIPYKKIFSFDHAGRLYVAVNRKGKKLVTIKRSGESKEEDVYLPEYSDECVGYYQISPSGLAKENEFKNAKANKLRKLRNQFKHPSALKISKKELSEHIIQSRNPRNAGRITMTLDGDLFETVFDENNLNVGFMLIKWERK